MIEIKWAHVNDCARIQPVFNHPEVIQWLGGFMMLEQLKGRAYSPKQLKAGLWYAEENGEVLGAMMCAGWPMSYRAKFGSVCVLPEHRRRHISTALYTCMMMQGIVEGRRLWEDSIVEDNPFQFHALPTFGLKKIGKLRHVAGSAKGIVLFDFSLIEDDFEAEVLPRTAEGFKFHLLESNFSREVWKDNQENYAKKIPGMETKISMMKELVLGLPYVQLHVDETDPTKERRKATSQRTLLE